VVQAKLKQLPPAQVSAVLHEDRPVMDRRPEDRVPGPAVVRAGTVVTTRAGAAVMVVRRHSGSGGAQNQASSHEQGHNKLAHDKTLL
jgi:hypothetical protein